jgi:hypothetical protein
VSVPEEVAGGAVSRDAEFWAASVTRFEAGSGPNVSGRRPTGPLQGFGKLWQRSYRAYVGTAASPEEAIAEWKAHFGSFWPKGNRFLGALTPIAPGDVAPIAIDTHAGFRVSTGVLVIYADERSFTFMTPEGHMFAGWITFSAARVQPVEGIDDGGTELDITVLIRPNDPLYELGWPVMRRAEDVFWRATLRNLAAHLGAGRVPVRISSTVVDRHRLWRNWRNVRHNAGVSSVVWTVRRPFRALAARRA